MSKPLIGEKLAVLVSNGFSEKDLVETQRVAQSLGATMRIISMDNGLVNSWNGMDWGLNFAADSALNAALAADYSMLVVPGGQRSIDKLKLTAHTRRFINGFVDASKPVVIMGEAIDLLEFAGKLAGMDVAGMDSKKDMAEAAGAKWIDGEYTIHGTVMTGVSVGDSSSAYMQAVQDFLVADAGEIAEAA